MNANQRIRVIPFVVAAFLLVSSCCLSMAGETLDERIADSIANLRNMDLVKDVEARKNKAEDMAAAIHLLKNAGEPAAKAIRAEADLLIKSGEKDDMFLLAAASILWDLERGDAAGDIAWYWANVTDLTRDPFFVFLLSMEAAQTADPKVLPILTAYLQASGDYFTSPRKKLEIRWPSTAYFVWGVWGDKNNDALVDILKNPEANREKLASAIYVLWTRYGEEGRKEIRRHVRSANIDARIQAVKALGYFGHPDDFDLLADSFAEAGAKSVPLTLAYMESFAQYGDLRADKLLIPFLESKNDAYLETAFRALYAQLPSVDAFAALDRRFSVSLEDEQSPGARVIAGEWPKRRSKALQEMGVSWGDFNKADRRQKQEWLLKWANKDWIGLYALASDDRRLTHEELEAVVADWVRDIYSVDDQYSWIEPRHVLAITDMTDLPMLQRARSVFLGLFSNGGRTRASMLTSIMQNIFRKAHREYPGVCLEVKPKEQKADKQ